MTPAKATETRVISLVDKVASPLLMTVPNVGNAMQINTDEDKSCAGGCLYCSNGLKPGTACKQKKPGRLLKRKEKQVIKIANICNPDAIFFQEKVEVGLDRIARDRTVRMIKGMHSDILSFATTKFTKSVWKHFDGLVNTCLLTSLTNPSGIKELEPGVPTYRQRLDAVYECFHKSFSLRLGVRVIIMKEADIDVIYKDVKKLIDKGVVKPEHCFIGCLRASIEKSADALNVAVGHLLPIKSQYAWAAQQGKTLRDDLLRKVIRKFSSLGVTFDRFPKNYREELGNVANFNDYIPRGCYLIPGAQCIKKRCADDHLYCRGYNKKGVICPALKDRSREEYARARRIWRIVYNRRRYGWGARFLPNSVTRSVWKVLFNSSLTDKFGFPRELVFCKFSSVDHPVVDLIWKEVN